MTQFPCIHLNGSHPSHLTEPLIQTLHLLKVARDELVNCAPHGRDYYTINEHAIDDAVAEHIVRLKRLDDTIAELKAIAQDILRQRDERDARRG